MKTPAQATILIVPGLRDHVEDHWQTHLERKLSSVRKVVTVPPLEADKLSIRTAEQMSAVYPGKKVVGTLTWERER